MLTRPSGPRPLPLLLLVALPLCVLGGLFPGAASADGGDPTVIHACAQRGVGNLRMVGPDEQCRPSEVPVHWPRGADGTTGGIGGRVVTCGPTAAGTLVYISGRSFVVITGADGSFELSAVPPGTYDVVIDVPGQAPRTITGVTVTGGTTTDLGQVSVPEAGCETCTDADNDGFFAQPGCNTQIDCNDSNPSVRPGATETCDGVDNNCDGQVDEGGVCGGPGCTDADRDGFFAQPGCGTVVDCNDADPNIRPGATETCDGVDNNCDGSIDETFPDLGTLCDGPDADACEEGMIVCSPDGGGTVCTDNTGASQEICGNNLDDDCDGLVDEPACV